MKIRMSAFTAMLLLAVCLANTAWAWEPSEYVLFPALSFLSISPNKRYATFCVNFRFRKPRHLRGSVKGVASGIWVLDLKLNAVYQITADSSDSSPSWSPDGKWIVFSRSNWKIGCTTLHRLNIQTFEVECISKEQHGRCERMPVWSPDGKSIAYIDTLGLWVMEVKSGKRHLVRKAPVGIARWTPDGRLICSAFEATQSCDLTDCSRINKLWVIEPKTGNVIHELELGCWHVTPEISPDGKRIVTPLGWHYGEELGLCIMTIDGQVELQLSVKRGIRRLNIPLRRLIKLPMKQITALCARMHIRVPELGRLSQFANIAKLNEHENIAPILRKVVSGRSARSLPDFISLAQLRKHSPLELSGLTAKEFARICKEAKFLSNIMDDNLFVPTGYTSWIDKHRIISIFDHNQTPKDIQLPPDVGIASSPLDIWMFDLEAQDVRRLTRFGELRLMEMRNGLFRDFSGKR